MIDPKSRMLEIERSDRRVTVTLTLTDEDAAIATYENLMRCARRGFISLDVGPAMPITRDKSSYHA